MAETELQIVARLRDRMSPAIRRLQQGFARLTRGVGGIIRRLTSFRTALIGALGGGALVAGTKNIAEQGRELDLWSRKLGTSAEELSALSAAAELAGFDFDILREGLKTLQERMDDASRGNATYQEQFARLGVDVLDTEGNLQNVVEILPKISAGFQRVAERGGAQELVLITEDLIGGSENLLSVWLNEGPQAMQALIDRARELGFALDSTFTFRSTRFSQAFNELQQSLLATAQQLFTTLEPYLTAGVRLVAEWVREFRDMDVTLNDISDWIDRQIEWLVRNVAMFLQATLTMAAQVVAVFEKIATMVANLGAVIRRELLGAISGVASAIADLLTLGDRLGGFGLLGDALDAVGAGPNDAASELRKIAVAFRVASDASAKMIEPVDLGSQSLRELATRSGETARGMKDQALSVLDLIPGFSRYAEILREVLEEQEKLTGNGGRGSGGGSRKSGLSLFFSSFGQQINQSIDQWRNFAQAGIEAANSIANTIQSGLTTAITDAILGLESWEDAFKAFGQLVVYELVRIIVQMLIVQAIGAAIGFFGGTGGVAAVSGAAGSGAAVGSAGGGASGAVGSSAANGFAAGYNRSIESSALRELRSTGAPVSGGGSVVVEVNIPVQSTASSTEVVAAINSSRGQVGAALEEVVRTTMSGRRAVGRRFS